MPSPTDPSPGRPFLVLGAVLAGIAVALGAFGTHALAPGLRPERLATWETATRYHLLHAVALLALGLALDRFPGAMLRTAGILITAGTVVFSGTLYLLVLTDTGILGAVTPVGGVLLILGWGLAAWGLMQGRTSAS